MSNSMKLQTVFRQTKFIGKNGWIMTEILDYYVIMGAKFVIAAEKQRLLKF